MALTLSDLRRPFRILAIVTGVIVAVPLAAIGLYTVVEPVSTPMLTRRILGEPVTRTWISFDDVDRRLVTAVLASEDTAFCLHHGVDWGELREVLDTEGGPRRGASTITMQVAKNLFLWPGRSWLRKGLEIPLALAIDAVWSKRRILEVYLNIAEWGPNGEFGIEAGSRRALGKGAGRLTATESALLAVMLPNPHKRDAGRPTRRLARLATVVARRTIVEAGLTMCLPRRPDEG